MQNKLQTLIIKPKSKTQNKVYALLDPSVSLCPSALRETGVNYPHSFAPHTPEAEFPHLSTRHMCVPAFKAVLWLFCGSAASVWVQTTADPIFNSKMTKCVYTCTTYARGQRGDVRERHGVMEMLVPVRLPASRDTFKKFLTGRHKQLEQNTTI